MLLSRGKRTIEGRSHEEEERARLHDGLGDDAHRVVALANAARQWVLSLAGPSRLDANASRLSERRLRAWGHTLWLPGTQACSTQTQAARAHLSFRWVRMLVECLANEANAVWLTKPPMPASTSRSCQATVTVSQ